MHPRLNERLPWLMNLTLVLLISLPNCALGVIWNDGAPPEFVERNGVTGIKVGNGNIVTDGATVILYPGAEVKFDVKVKDEDAFTDNDPEIPNPDPTDGTSANWAADEGTWKDDIDRSLSVTYIAPQDEGEFDLTVEADDDTESPDGDPIGQYDTGDREDAPGETIEITIIVTSACPASMTRTACKIPTTFTDTFWTEFPVDKYGNELSTLGWTRFSCTVSGGTPPGGAEYWNGLYVEEDVDFDENDPGTADASDFVVSPGSRCDPTADGFVVGVAAPTVHKFHDEGETWSSDPPCSAAATNNVFYDNIVRIKWGTPDYSGPDGKTTRCVHDYKCNGQLLKSFIDEATWETDTVAGKDRNPVRIDNGS